MSSVSVYSVSVTQHVNVELLCLDVILSNSSLHGRLHGGYQLVGTALTR